MQTLYRVNAFISRHLPWFVLGCVAIGLTFADTLSQLSHITVFLFAFMTFTNSLGGDFRDLAKVARHPLPVGVMLLLLHVVMPLLTMLVGNVLFPGAPLFALGLLLEFSIPTAITSLMWVGIGGGDMPLCLAVVLLDTLLSPFIVPLSLRLFSGSVVEMDAASMMVDLLFMVAIPAVIAMSLHQKTHGRVKTTLKPRLEPFSKLALLLLITINATGCASFLRDIDRTLILVIVSLISLCLFAFFLGYWAGRALHLPFPSVLSTSMVSGSRNISAGAVLAAQYFPAEVMFPVVAGTLFQQILAAICEIVVSRVLGTGEVPSALADEKAAPDEVAVAARTR